MSAGPGVIANLVDVINEVFHADVILTEGASPMRYRSVLKRLFLSNAAKLEIERLKELEATNAGLQATNQRLNGENQQLKQVNSELNGRLKTYSSPEAVAAIRQKQSTVELEAEGLRQQLKNAPKSETLEKAKAELATEKERSRQQTLLLKQVREERDYLQQKLAELTDFGKAANAGFERLVAKRTANSNISDATVPTPTVSAEPAVTPSSAEIASQSGNGNKVTDVTKLQSDQVSQPSQMSQEAQIQQVPPRQEQTSSAASDQQKVLAFLKAHRNQAFSKFELSLALGLSEQAICDAAQACTSQITVSQNELTFKEN
jgi:hypothetical protein